MLAGKTLFFLTPRRGDTWMRLVSHQAAREWLYFKKLVIDAYRRDEQQASTAGSWRLDQSKKIRDFDAGAEAGN